MGASTYKQFPEEKSFIEKINSVKEDTKNEMNNQIDESKKNEMNKQINEYIK